MSNILPLFPLNIVVFPGEKLNLHIFENRYKQLVLDCGKNHLLFGMPAFFQNKVADYGTTLQLLSIEKTHANGELDIKTKGMQVFKIKELYKTLPDKLYAGGLVEVFEDNSDEEILIKSELMNELQKFYKALQIDNIYINPPNTFRAYDLAHHVGLSVAQEYLLLQIRNESERQEYILEHLRKVVPLLAETEKLKERIRLNGHFKHLHPPTF